MINVQARRQAKAVAAGAELPNAPLKAQLYGYYARLLVADVMAEINDAPVKHKTHHGYSNSLHSAIQSTIVTGMQVMPKAHVGQLNMLALALRKQRHPEYSEHSKSPALDRLLAGTNTAVEMQTSLLNTIALYSSAQPVSRQIVNRSRKVAVVPAMQAVQTADHFEELTSAWHDIRTDEEVSVFDTNAVTWQPQYGLYLPQELTFPTTTYEAAGEPTIGCPITLQPGAMAALHTASAELYARHNLLNLAK